MPAWLVGLLVGFLGGVGTTLLRLPHERAADLRTRMLEAADDFVAAYTTAQEATREAVMQVELAEWHLEETQHEDVPPELEREWVQKRRAAAAAAEEACAALKRREPRIALLFERLSPAHRSAWLAYVSLSGIAMSASLGPRPSAAADGEKQRRATESERADKHLNEFSQQARKAILASPWSTRPILVRGRRLRRKIGERLRRIKARVAQRGSNAEKP